MPTGYTADLEGVTFPKFALSCARAFGALVTMRDEPSGVPIPDRIEPSSYSCDRLAGSFGVLIGIKSWSDAFAEKEAKTVHAQALERRTARMNETDATRKRYEAMIRCVEDWKPPTPDHVGLKDFMLEQLTKSIEWDCSGGFSEPTARSGQDHKHHCLCAILKNIAYQAKNYREELERARGRTEWVRQLRASLDQS